MVKMNLAKKIINLRKQKGWSQEELASRLDVSRQSVSKWESNVSVPEMDKILQLSDLFQVTTDYLLKDDLVEEHAALDEEELELITPKNITAEEASTYLSSTKKESKIIALGVMLCMLAGANVVFFGGTSESKVILGSESTQLAVGLIGLFLLIAIAVTLFITSSNRSDQYKYLSTTVLSLQKRYKEELKEEYHTFVKKYNLRITFSVVMLILSALPLIIGGLFDAGEYTLIMLVVLLIVLASIAVFIIVQGTIELEGYKTLLNKMNRSKRDTKVQKEIDSYETIFWMIALAIYLGWSFYTNNWGISWIVWPIAGVLSAIIPELVKLKNK
jgi:transcriptional regulator with XRE-family HTH domain